MSGSGKGLNFSSEEDSSEESSASDWDSEEERASCPLCGRAITVQEANKHIDECLNMQTINSLEINANKAPPINQQNSYENYHYDEIDSDSEDDDDDLMEEEEEVKMFSGFTYIPRDNEKKLQQVKDRLIVKECPNSINPFHECNNYCKEKYQKQNSNSNSLPPSNISPKINYPILSLIDSSKSSNNSVNNNNNINNKPRPGTINNECPNTSNPFHECNNYCKEKYQKQNANSNSNSLPLSNINPNLTNNSIQPKTISNNINNNNVNINNNNNINKPRYGTIRECPNASNLFHECSNYCKERYQKQNPNLVLQSINPNPINNPIPPMTNISNKINNNVNNNNNNINNNNNNNLRPGNIQECPNASNPYHQCSNYCKERYQNNQSQSANNSQSIPSKLVLDNPNNNNINNNNNNNNNNNEEKKSFNSLEDFLRFSSMKNSYSLPPIPPQQNQNQPAIKFNLNLNQPINSNSNAILLNGLQTSHPLPVAKTPINLFNLTNAIPPPPPIPPPIMQNIPNIQPVAPQIPIVMPNLNPNPIRAQKKKKRNRAASNSGNTVYCPYSPACPRVECSNFPSHVITYHIDANYHNFSCPVCILLDKSMQAEFEQAVQKNTMNLLNHVLEFHPEALNNADETPQPREIKETLVQIPTKIGNGFVEQVLTSTIENKECAICFETFEVGNKVAWMECFCVFHSHCITSWNSVKTRQGNCPVHSE